MTGTEKQVSSSAHPAEIVLRLALPVVAVGFIIYWLPVLAVLVLGLLLVAPVLMLFMWIVRK